MMENPHSTYPHQVSGGLICLQARSTNPIALLGATWAMACGVVASGGRVSGETAREMTGDRMYDSDAEGAAYFQGLTHEAQQELLERALPSEWCVY